MSFLWAAHQVPSTRWIKAEIAERAPHLKFAFARPGLTTWKVEGAAATPATILPSSFARAFGLSIGRAQGAAEVFALIAPYRDRPLRLHVIERDIDVSVDEQDPANRGTRSSAVEAALRTHEPGAFLADVRAGVGDRMIDVVVPHGREPDEPWLVGVHDHNDYHGPWPGGVAHVPPPAEAPSRAWCKIEEALRWADLDPKPGGVAVELGSSPGGASYAMLARGLEIHGVDPGAMDPRVLGFRGPHGNKFVHHRVPAAEVRKSALPYQYQWLLNDINLAPMVALRYVERFVALAHGGLEAAIITLKLNDDGVFAALPRLVERLRRMGPRRVRVTQLPSNRSEVAAILTW